MSEEVPEDPQDDGVLTRTEQQLWIDVEQWQSSRVRLRKYVVTEQVTLTFALCHEELQVERECIEECGADLSASDRQLGEGNLEIVLYAERLVVRKEQVPAERVRALRRSVTRDQTVCEDLRQESCAFRGKGLK